MANHPSKLDQLRALREANAERSKPNPFQDAARGRDPAPTSSAPVDHAPQNNAERLPSSDAAAAGAEAKRKTGRPRLGEVRDKPWEAAGMSRSTWYRRKAEERGQ